MNVCQGLLNGLQVSSWELEELIQIARENGALGAKLTGGGGGGSMIALCPDNADAGHRRDAGRRLSGHGGPDWLSPRLRDQRGVVSSEEEPLILVDETDREIGHLSKGECHDGDGVLHRAFSLFIFNSAGELLLQQRSAEKAAVAAVLVQLLLQPPAPRRDHGGGDRTTAGPGTRDGEPTFTTSSPSSTRRAISISAPRTRCVRSMPESATTRRDPTKPRSPQSDGSTPTNSIVSSSSNPKGFTPWFAQEWPRVRDAFHRGLRST